MPMPKVDLTHILMDIDDQIEQHLNKIWDLRQERLKVLKVVDESDESLIVELPKECIPSGH